METSQLPLSGSASLKASSEPSTSLTHGQLMHMVHHDDQLSVLLIRLLALQKLEPPLAHHHFVFSILCGPEHVTHIQ